MRDERTWRHTRQLPPPTAVQPLPPAAQPLPPTAVQPPWSPPPLPPTAAQPLPPTAAQPPWSPPPAAPHPGAPTPAAPRRRRRRWWLAGALVVVAAVGLGGAAERAADRASRDKAAEQPGAAAPAAPAPAPGGPAPGDQAPAAPAPAAPGPADGAVDPDAIPFGTRWTWDGGAGAEVAPPTPFDNRNPFLGPAPGNRLVTVPVTLVNGSDRTRNALSWSITATVDGAAATENLQSQLWVAQEIPAGETLLVTKVYEVPAAPAELRVSVDGTVLQQVVFFVGTV